MDPDADPWDGDARSGRWRVALLDRLGYRGVVALEGWASGDPEQALERFRTAFTPG